MEHTSVTYKQAKNIRRFHRASMSFALKLKSYIIKHNGYRNYGESFVSYRGGWLQQVKNWGRLRLRVINIRASGIKFQRNEESLPDRIVQTEQEGNTFSAL
jgi:hypothetical protein